jgi:hypothetical protein
MSIFKGIFAFIKENSTFLYTAFVMTLLMFDYYIYTDVFHLHQSDFFNDFLPNMLLGQLFIVFIVFPLVIIGIILFIFKLEYNFFDKYEIKNYFKMKGIALFIGIGFLSGLAIFNDIIVYYIIEGIFNICENLKISCNTASFLITLNLLYFFFNWVTLLLLSSITALSLEKLHFSKKISSHYIFSFFLGIFVSFKIVFLPIFSYLVPALSIPNNFKIFIILNLCIFIALGFMFAGNKGLKDDNNDDGANTNSKYQIFLVSTTVIITIVTSIVFFNNLEKLYKRPYQELSFWNKKVDQNGLSKVNISLLLNPLKIRKEEISIDIELIPKEKIPKSINQDIFFKHKNNTFYLPNGNKKLVFLQSIDDNKTILILYASKNATDIIDVGYIDLDITQ